MISCCAVSDRVLERNLPRFCVEPLTGLGRIIERALSSLALRGEGVSDRQTQVELNKAITENRLFGLDLTKLRDR